MPGTPRRRPSGGCCAASPRRRTSTPDAGARASLENILGAGAPLWQVWAQKGDWAAIIRWAVDAGHADVDEVELGMPALDMQLGVDAPTFFDMLGMQEYAMTSADEAGLAARAAAVEAALRQPPEGRPASTVARDCALLELAVAALSGAAARAEYRGALAEYRQETLAAVREYHRAQQEVRAPSRTPLSHCYAG